MHDQPAPPHLRRQPWLPFAELRPPPELGILVLTWWELDVARRRERSDDER